MKPFDHFIITRFNLKNYDANWSLDKNKNDTLSNNWLEHRLDLFQRYCIPSLLNQTNGDFKWVLYFDTSTDIKYRKIIEDLPKSYPMILIRYVNGYDGFSKKYPEDIVKWKDTKKEYLITSRIDNDDVLHKGMVDRIQQSFDFQNFKAVNFSKIYCLKLNPPRELFLRILFSNHFVSLIEKVKNNKINGCYSRMDHEWNVKGQVLQITDDVYCMELIHERNLLNRLRGFPIPIPKELTHFQIPEKNQFQLRSSYLKLWKMPWLKLLKCSSNNHGIFPID